VDATIDQADFNLRRLAAMFVTYRPIALTQRGQTIWLFLTAERS